MAITAAHVARSPRIRLGMVGGGRGAFIGAVHRIASRIDDQYELVAGAFSSDPERSAASAADLGVARSYGSFAEMAQKEARRKDGIEAVAIVTPNHMHAPVALRISETRHPCDLRQTADRHPARGQKAGQGRRGLRRDLRADPQLHRLSDDPPSQGDGRRRAIWAIIRLVQVEYAQDWLAA